MGFEKDEKKILKVLMAGVPIPSQTVNWNFIPGANAYITSIKIPRDDHAKIKDVATKEGKDKSFPLFISLHITTQELGSDDDLDIDFKLENLVLLDANEVDSPYEATWSIADRRFLLNGLTVTGSYNVTRGTNDKGIVGKEFDKDPGDKVKLATSGAGHPDTGEGGTSDPPPAAGTPAAGKDGVPMAPDTPVAVVASFQKKNYLDWTIRPDGKPKTALEIIVDALRKTSKYASK